MDLFKSYLDNEIAALQSGAFIAPTRGTYNLSVVAADGATVPLSWAENGFVVQDHVLDLADPLNPVGVTAGLYTVSVVLHPTANPGVSWTLDLNLDYAGDDPEVTVEVPGFGANKSGSLSLSYLMPVAGVIVLNVTQNSGGPVSFTGHAYVTVIPT